MILLPLSLYPLLTLTLVSLATSQKKEEGERSSIVCVRGAAAPALSRALEGAEKINLAGPGCGEADIKRREVHAILELPPGFEDALVADSPRRATVLYDETEDRSRLGADRIQEVITSFTQERRQALLSARGLPKSLVAEAPLDRKSVASARESGAAMVGKVLPILVLF